MPQYARPISDTTDGGWTSSSNGTVLFDELDESSVDDLTYIKSQANVDTDTFRIKLDTLNDPFSSSGHTLRYRIGRIGSSPSYDFKMQLQQGTTTIAEWEHLDVSTSLTTYAQTLTSDQTDAITDYSDLYIQGKALRSPVIRDDFTTTVNPLVDGAAVPGPGTRDVAASSVPWFIKNAALRGGVQASSPSWSTGKLLYSAPAITRANGIAMIADVIPIDREADMAFGWAISTGASTPLTTGHHWLVNEGYGRVSMPGKTVELHTVGTGQFGFVRNMEYVPIVVARARGAFYLVAAHDQQVTMPNATQPVHPPAFSSGTALLLHIDDADTTTPIYPDISAFDRNGPVDGHYIDQFYVQPVTEWESDQGLMSFLDRTVRADSNTSAGTGWTASGGVGGVSSNKLYVVSNTGGRTQIVRTGVASSGDSHWRWKVTVGSNPADQIECIYRYVDANNYCMVYFTSTAVWVYVVTGGVGANLFNYPLTKSAGQVLDVCVKTYGAYHQLMIDDGTTTFNDYAADSSNSTVRNGTGIGYGSWAVAPTGARWTDIAVAPQIVTIPQILRERVTPHDFTVGATIATDDFTAANGTALNGRTTTTGSKTWTTFGSGWEINTNRARNTNTNGAANEYYARIDAGVADYEISVDVTMPASFDTIHDGILFRYIDANNFCYARFVEDPGQPTNNEVEIWEWIGGVQLDTCKTQYGDYLAGSGTYNLKVQVVGRYVHVYVDSKPVLSYVISISDITTGTNVGIYHAGDDDGSSFDSFSVKALT